MPRRYRPARREVEEDLRYDSQLLTRLINKVMEGGKKNLATRIVYDAMDIIEERTNKSGVEVFEEAVQNVSPVLAVRARRVGGSTYQIPVEVTPERRTSLALRWILDAARRRPSRSMSEKLAGELMDASNRTGAAFKKREDTHRMAEANRAFAHYRW